MTRLEWQQEEPSYEIGVDHGVLYPTRTSKLEWNGLISVKESPENEGVKPIYFEGRKLTGTTDVGNFSGSITAFTYPEELDDLKDIYAITFRTLGENNKTRLHIIYNPVLVSDAVDYQSFGSNIDPIKFSWSMTNKPTYLTGYAPSGHFIIEFYNVPDPFVNEIEFVLYDTSGVFPTPQDLIDIFEEMRLYRTLLIIDHHDGSWTAIGSDEMVYFTDPTSFEIDSTTAIFLDAETYTVSSL